MTDAFTIRPLAGIDEYRACVDLQEETWGRGFSERVPTAILMVSQILGGVASGAWSPEGRLAGFVFGMTGIRDGRPVHWSDMLAVRPEARGTGLGRALKLHQRDAVRALGVDTMLWTFDPLRARNAHLNFARLGVVARDYVEDMYGQTDSPLHRGVGTDRLVARWLLDSPRVASRLADHGPHLSSSEVARLPAALDRLPGDGEPRPGKPRIDLDGPAIRMVIPPDIGRLMEHAPDLASAWRGATRVVLRHYLDAGWEVADFVRDPHAPAYVLASPTSSPDPSPPSSR